MDSFLRAYEKNENIKSEKKRIGYETFLYTNEGKNLEFIKNNISSEIIDDIELKVIIENHYRKNISIIENRKISSKIILKTIFATLISSVTGSIFFCFLILGLKIIWWKPFIILVYILNYQLIKLITKRNRDNIVIFIGALIGTIISLLITYLFLKNIVTLQP
ncbi:MAG: hypothetical protein QM535_04500 [Limnohabitans sp.]|nr:hypothetical protein [Limnohabitans sp.]